MSDKNTANIGFEKQIWDAACVLRGNMDASEYKNVVLGLIFLKYISDRFDDRYQQVHVGVRLRQKHIRRRLVQLLMRLCVQLKKKIND